MIVLVLYTLALPLQFAAWVLCKAKDILDEASEFLVSVAKEVEQSEQAKEPKP